MVTMQMRLDPQAYQALERMVLSDVPVTSQTTEIMAGYMLGIQKVLKILRDGYVVETPR